MKIYIGHSRDMDYIDDLYEPIREYEKGTDHIFILPHENNSKDWHGRDFYNNLDIFIAEVSLSTTGLGIELGWAYDSNIPIYCIYKKGQKISSSLKSVTDNFFEYGTSADLIDKIKLIINENDK